MPDRPIPWDSTGDIAHPLAMRHIVGRQGVLMFRSIKLAMALTCLSLTSAAAPPEKVEVGKVAPPYELKLMDGSKINSGDLKGYVVILNFWATWCVPCREELPLLDVYADAQKKAGLKVFAVATEDSVPNSQLKKLFAVMRMSPVRYLKGPYKSMGGLPTNIVIDRSGKIRFAKAGAFNLDSLNALIVPMLREPVPPGITVKRF